MFSIIRFIETITASRRILSEIIQIPTYSDIKIKCGIYRNVNRNTLKPGYNFVAFDLIKNDQQISKLQSVYIESFVKDNKKYIEKDISNFKLHYEVELNKNHIILCKIKNEPFVMYKLVETMKNNGNSGKKISKRKLRLFVCFDSARNSK